MEKRKRMGNTAEREEGKREETSKYKDVSHVTTMEVMV